MKGFSVILVVLLITFLSIACAETGEEPFMMFENITFGLSQNDVRARLCGYDAFDNELGSEIGLAVSSLAMNESRFSFLDTSDYMICMLDMYPISESIGGSSLFAYDMNSENFPLVAMGYFIGGDVYNEVSPIIESWDCIRLSNDASYRVMSDVTKTMVDGFKNYIGKDMVPVLTSYIKESKEEKVLVEHMLLSGADFVICSILDSSIKLDASDFEQNESYVSEQPQQEKEWLEIAKKVSYIGQRSVAHITPDNVQRVWFALMDENEKQLAAPAIVDIEIVNDNGEVVYTQTHYVSPNDYATWSNSLTNAQNLLCSIDIPDKDIMPGSSKTGIINIAVHYKTEYAYNGAIDVFSFSEYSKEVRDLPYDSPINKSTLEIVSLPESVSYFQYGAIESTVTIEDVSYEFTDSGEQGMVDLTISFTGKKIFDATDDNNSNECRIGIKLYQDEYVIESGFVRTTSLAVGEGYRNASVTYRGLEPGNYQLKIIDVE